MVKARKVADTNSHIFSIPNVKIRCDLTWNNESTIDFNYIYLDIRYLIIIGGNQAKAHDVGQIQPIRNITLN
jgi:hypothetical protein